MPLHSRKRYPLNEEALWHDIHIFITFREGKIGGFSRNGSGGKALWS